MKSDCCGAEVYYRNLEETPSYCENCHKPCTPIEEKEVEDEQPHLKPKEKK